MEPERTDLPAEETQEHTELPEEEQKPVKSPWQMTKESWYDKVPLNLKQLNIIVYCCWGLLALVFVLIVLDAAGIYSLF